MIPIELPLGLAERELLGWNFTLKSFEPEAGGAPVLFRRSAPPLCFTLLRLVARRFIFRFR
jgi:hypothetical protein